MRYAFFTGCTAPVRTMNYELSSRNVAKRLGIELLDLDFRCCGFSVEPVNKEAALIMTALNLAIAEEKKLNITTICSACAGTLTRFNEMIKRDDNLMAKTNAKLKTLGYTYHGSTDIKHFLRVLYEDVGPSKISENIACNLGGVRVAAHYGCHYHRPSEIYHGFDDPEKPHILDELIEATGAESVDYETKDLCCGGGVLAIDKEVAMAMSEEKLADVKDKVDTIVVICPFCGLMYDMGQLGIEAEFKRTYGIPVLYYPQLLGLAMGLSPEELGFGMNRIETKSLLNKLGTKGGGVKTE